MVVFFGGFLVMISLWCCVTAEYRTLCPGGEGFRPNPITVIVEGQTDSSLQMCLNYDAHTHTHTCMLLSPMLLFDCFILYCRHQ